MVVERKSGEWLLFNDSPSGSRARVYDVVIPPDLPESRLGQYLDDMYHELATEKHPGVVRII